MLSHLKAVRKICQGQQQQMLFQRQQQPANAISTTIAFWGLPFFMRHLYIQIIYGQPLTLLLIDKSYFQIPESPG